MGGANPGSLGENTLPFVLPVECEGVVGVRGIPTEGFRATGGGILLGFLCNGGFSSGLRGPPCALSSATMSFFSEDSASCDVGGSNTNFFELRENTKLAAEAGDLWVEGDSGGFNGDAGGAVGLSIGEESDPCEDLCDKDLRTGF